MVNTRTPIQSALLGKQWSVSGLLFGVDYVRDEQGRPLGERRAPADTRRDVPMELVPCRYADERFGGQMNTSALKQITAELAWVTADISAFHQALRPRGPGWEPMFNAVIDQLASPALHLLQTRSDSGPVPVRAAVGHKLAAGYFGAMRALLLAEARGRDLPATVDGFLSFVHEGRFLIGASEVCAGQPANIVRATEAFFQGRGDPGETAAPERVAVSRGLSDQVRLGLVWSLFDTAMERSLLCGPQADRLAPRTEYLARRMATRVDELSREPADSDPSAALPHSNAAAITHLRQALANRGRGAASEKLIGCVAEVLAHGDGAIELESGTLRTDYIRHLADILAVYCALVAAHWHIEKIMRQAVDYTIDAPMKLSALMFPDPRALSWVEIFTGHRIHCTPADTPQISLRNRHRVVDLPENAPSSAVSSASP